MPAAEENMRTFFADRDVPAQAADMLGHEVEDAFRLARERQGGAPAAGDDADAGGEPVVIAAVGNDDWRGGVFMIVEQLGQGPGAERVASIRQLVIAQAHRGRGLAGWLLRRAQTVAIEMRCRRIRTTAGWGCPDHLGMYQRLGYERTDSDERPYLMEKVL